MITLLLEEIQLATEATNHSEVQKEWRSLMTFSCLSCSLRISQYNDYTVICQQMRFIFFQNHYQEGSNVCNITVWIQAMN